MYAIKNKDNNTYLTVRDNKLKQTSNINFAYVFKTVEEAKNWYENLEEKYNYNFAICKVK